MDNIYNEKVIMIKKILVVSSKFPREYSGSGLRAYNTYKRLEKKYNVKWDVIANSISFQGNSLYKFKNKKVFRISSPIKKNYQNFLLKKSSIFFSIIWETIFTLIFLIKNGDKYKMLHTFGNSWSIGVSTLYFYFKKKSIIRELVNSMKNPFYPKQMDFLIKKVFFKDKNLVVAISKELEILSLKNKIRSIWQRPNPFDEKKFYIDYKNKYKLRKLYSKFSKTDVVLCYVASLIDTKNHIFLLKVLKLLPTNFKLIISGPENINNLNMYSKISKEIKNLSLSSRIQFEKKFIDNIDEYMKLSDVYLIPSNKEGFGTSILEAQACGIPVVSFLLKNVNDNEIIEGEGGYFSSASEKMFAKKIKLSLKISKKTLIKNSKFISSRASAKVIDKLYFKKISQLANSKNYYQLKYNNN